MLTSMSLLAQQSGEAFGGFAFLLFILVFAVLMIVSLWKVFEKAGQPGWAVIVQIIPGILIPLGIAKNFGKGVGFGIGLLFLGFIFYPILAFGDAEYNPTEAQFTSP